MSKSLFSALNAAMQTSAPKKLRGATNMIGEVLGYTEKSVKVKALNGPLKGEEMEISMAASSKVQIADLTKKSRSQTSMYTVEGGVLRFDNVRKSKDGDGYVATWVNTWKKDPNDANIRITDEVLAQFVDTNTTTKAGNPYYVVNVLQENEERLVSGLGEIREGLIEALTNHGAVMIVGIEDGNYQARINNLPGKNGPDGYQLEDPVAYTDTLIDRMTQGNPDLLDSEDLDPVTLVPVTPRSIGGDTAKAIATRIDEARKEGKPARIQSVNPGAYNVAPLGQRLAWALLQSNRSTGERSIPDEHSKRLADDFLSTAAEDAKAAFHKDGWAGVADADLKSFFSARGVELKTHPTTGWARTPLKERKFEGSDNYFVEATHEMARYASPYPLLECTREIRAAYGSELVDAVTAVMAGPQVEKSAEAETPAADTAEAPKVDEPVADLDSAVQDVDDLLMDVLGGEPNS